ncbi:MAG: glycosyltransferase [Bacteroidota bacterium]
MKVLHYCGTFSRLSQTFIYDVILQLNEENLSNVVVANKLSNRIDRPYANVIKLPAGQTIGTVLKKLLGKLRLYKYNWREDSEKKKARDLQKVVSIEKPNVIHAHFGTHGCVILPVALELGIPLVVSFHGFDAFRLPHEKGWSAKYLDLFAGASAVTVVSQLMKAHLLNLGCPADKLKVIHVGKKMRDYTFRKAQPDAVRSFVSIGRLTAKKGHEDAICAFQKVLKTHPELSLEIIGTGEQETELKLLIADAPLHQNITLSGALSHPETKKRLAASDAFILCSKTGPNGDMEGIPTVLMEAQAMGLPCVSTIHSGIPEVIPAENQWLLANEGNVDAIADKILKLVEAGQADLEDVAKRGREKVEQEFNLETEVRKLKELYRQLNA